MVNVVCLYYLQLAINEDSLYGAAYAFLGHVYKFKTYDGMDKDEFKNFWREGAPLIEPKPIPEFKPKKRVFRMDGVVI